MTSTHLILSRSLVHPTLRTGGVGIQNNRVQIPLWLLRLGGGRQKLSGAVLDYILMKGDIGTKSFMVSQRKYCNWSQAE